MAGSANPEQVVLSYVRKQTEQTFRSRSENSTSPWPLLQWSAESSCLDFPSDGV